MQGADDASQSTSAAAESGDAGRILASGLAAGRPVQVVEYPNGSVAILFDGHETALYRNGKRSIEACIDAYLDLVRSAVPPIAGSLPTC